MAIVQTVNLYHFREAFRLAGRKDHFSYEGLKCMFDYLEEYSDSMGEPLELDVIAICCDYCEQDVEDIVDSYNIDIEGLDEDEVIDAVREFLIDNTALVGEPADGVFVYQQF